MFMSIAIQALWLFLLAIPVACVSWTVTHEEVFREPREYCSNRCKKGVGRPPRHRFILDFKQHVRLVRVSRRVKIPEIRNVGPVVVTVPSAIPDGDHQIKPQIPRALHNAVNPA